MSAPERNISTEHQPKGSARNLSDTLDRKDEQVRPGQRQWADDSAQKPDDTDDKAADRGSELPESGAGDDRPDSVRPG